MNGVVLVVEDDFIMRLDLARFLRATGFDVIEAGDAGDAMSVLQRSRVDAVVTDVAMPGDFDGIGLARWLRAHFLALPVVLTSGYVTGQPSELPFFPKPYDLSEMAKRLEKAISDKV